MQMLSLVWGILVILGMLVGFIPCLGWLNWFNIPLAGIGIIVSALASSSATAETKQSATIGMILCIVALFFGIIRLVIGAGVI